jgi:hypothetical protein
MSTSYWLIEYRKPSRCKDVFTECEQPIIQLSFYQGRIGIGASYTLSADLDLHHAHFVAIWTSMGASH